MSKIDLEEEIKRYKKESKKKLVDQDPLFRHWNYLYNSFMAPDESILLSEALHRAKKYWQKRKN